MKWQRLDSASLRHGLPHTIGNGDGNVKIHECASIGDCNGVRKELGNGVSVDARDEQDYTPLAYAANSSAGTETMRVLIDAGADVNAAVDHSKSFPVGLAACGRD